MGDGLLGDEGGDGGVGVFVWRHGLPGDGCGKSCSALSLSWVGVEIQAKKETKSAVWLFLGLTCLFLGLTCLFLELRDQAGGLFCLMGPSRHPVPPILLSRSSLRAYVSKY